METYLDCSIINSTASNILASVDVNRADPITQNNTNTNKIGVYRFKLPASQIPIFSTAALQIGCISKSKNTMITSASQSLPATMSTIYDFVDNVNNALKTQFYSMLSTLNESQPTGLGDMAQFERKTVTFSTTISNTDPVKTFSVTLAPSFASCRCARIVIRFTKMFYLDSYHLDDFYQSARISITSPTGKEAVLFNNFTVTQFFPDNTFGIVFDTSAANIIIMQTPTASGSPFSDFTDLLIDEPAGIWTFKASAYPTSAGYQFIGSVDFDLYNNVEYQYKNQAIFPPYVSINSNNKIQLNYSPNFVLSNYSIVMNKALANYFVFPKKIVNDGVSDYITIDFGQMPTNFSADPNKNTLSLEMQAYDVDVGNIHDISRIVVSTNLPSHGELICSDNARTSKILVSYIVEKSSNDGYIYQMASNDRYYNLYKSEISTFNLVFSVVRKNETAAVVEIAPGEKLDILLKLKQEID